MAMTGGGFNFWNYPHGAMCPIRGMSGMGHGFMCPPGWMFGGCRMWDPSCHQHGGIGGMGGMDHGFMCPPGWMFGPVEWGIQVAVMNIEQ